MFGRIAARYDLLNTLMTFGQDARWRQAVADDLASVGRSARVLDVGTGTGRLARAIQDRYPAARVVGLDFTLPMLRHAPGGLRLAAADAQRLPCSDSQFDAVVSGFLVRNLGDLEQGLAEQVRVLRPGGLLVILETTPGPRRWPLSALYLTYFRHVVPQLGRLLAGDASAYTYLPESTLSFVEPARLAELLGRFGLHDVHIRSFALGSVAVISGRKAAILVPGEAK
jgi:demethylmenaquinone methyltransferase/2-methoxy-6-polyprenyl-1,4-benzoquinol methylase